MRTIKRSVIPGVEDVFRVDRDNEVDAGENFSLMPLSAECQLPLRLLHRLLRVGDKFFFFFFAPCSSNILAISTAKVIILPTLNNRHSLLVPEGFVEKGGQLVNSSPMGGRAREISSRESTSLRPSRDTTE